MKILIPVFNYQMVQNVAAERVDIFVDGNIVDEPSREFMADWYGDESSVSFKSLRTQMLASDSKNFLIHVNSGGGHVGDAMAIHDMIVSLNSQGYNIDTHGCGIIASAATYILMAGKKTTITENSMMMIHNVSGGIRGNVTEIENYARSMRKFNDLITNFYVNKTGKPAATITDWMNKETWMDGNEASQNGFVMETTKAANFKNAIKKEHWQYSNTAALNTYNSFVNNKPMNIKELVANIKASLTTAFGNTGTPAQRDEAIIKAITDGLGGIETVVNTAVDERVNAAMNSQATATAVGNAIAAGLKTVPENFKTAITDATTTLATKEELENLKTELANKLAGTGGGKDKGKPGNSADDLAEHEGWSWGK